MNHRQHSGPRAFRRLAAAFGLAILLAAGAGLALAAVRASANYRVTLDALTAGGGAAASASYRETDSALGQECLAGPGLSASYRTLDGIVQNWSPSGNAAAAWRGYQ